MCLPCLNSYIDKTDVSNKTWRCLPVKCFVVLQVWVHVIRRQQQRELRWGERLQRISRSQRKTARVDRPAPANNPQPGLPASTNQQRTSTDCRQNCHSRLTAESQPVCNCRHKTARQTPPVASAGHCYTKLCLTATSLGLHCNSSMSGKRSCLYRDRQPAIRKTHSHPGDHLHIIKHWIHSWTKLREVLSYLFFIAVRH